MSDHFEMFDDNTVNQKYMLLDLSNHMHRCRNGLEKSGKVIDNNYVLQVALNGIFSFYTKIRPTKIVIAVDHSSWRKDVLSMYKAGRAELKKDESWIQFMEYIKEFEELLSTHSTMIFLKHPKIEADDWIARWIQTHPLDKHVIVSSDSDFYQLHGPNVSQYHPVKEKYIEIDNPQWELFLKCIRGETGKTSDNIPSAYPRVREDKLQRAFFGNEFLMETIMQTEVPDITCVEPDGSFKMSTVHDLYQRNKSLIDLSEQPQHIKDIMDATIETASTIKNKFEMFYFLRYLGRHGLVKISDQADRYTKMMSL